MHVDTASDMVVDADADIGVDTVVIRAQMYVQMLVQICMMDEGAYMVVVMGTAAGVYTASDLDVGIDADMGVDMSVLWA